MGYTDYFNSRKHDAVRILSIGKSGARCVTSYNSELTIPWDNHLPDPIPNVGETWIVEKISSNIWTFKYKVARGSFNVMSYAMMLDASTCVGRERAIADDIAGAGVTEVFLKVADDMSVMWDSKVAQNFGLRSFGDNVTQMLKRLKNLGISVTLSIDAELWSDQNDDSLAEYQQIKQDKDGNETRSVVMSPSGAKLAVKALVNELKFLYQPYIVGFCIDGIRMDGENSDFNSKAKAEFLANNGYVPDYSITEYDGTESWWEKNGAWIESRERALSSFASEVRTGLGSMSLSAIIPQDAVKTGRSGVKSGRAECGIGDEFASSWSAVGMPMSFSRSSDKASELRSLEMFAAYEKRLAKNSVPFYVLDLDSLDQPDGVFEILAKYDANKVVFDSYEKWRLLSDEKVISLKEAMSKYKVTERSTSQHIGLVLSSDSRDVSAYDLESNTSYTDAAESLCSSLLDKLPHRLKVLFDSDIEDVETIRSVACAVFFMVSNMSDESVQAVEKALSSSDKSLVFVGRTGYMVGRSSRERDRMPFLAQFGQSEYLTQEYVKEIKVDAPYQTSEAVYTLESNNIGIKPVLGGTSAKSFVQTSDGYEEVDAPLMFLGRSSMLGIDASNDDQLLDISGDLALYAIGRD